MSFTGVDQTTPNEADNGAEWGPATIASVNVTTISDNAWVLGSFASIDTTRTVGSGQTERVTINEAASGDPVLSMSHEGPVSPAASEDTSWTVPANRRGVISAIAIKPVAAGGLSIPVAMNSYRQRHQSVV